MVEEAPVGSKKQICGVTRKEGKACVWRPCALHHLSRLCTRHVCLLNVIALSDMR